MADVHTITIDQIKCRLRQLGYAVTLEDCGLVEYELDKIVNYTLNYCNIRSIPEVLNPRIIDRVCSEILFFKKNSGQLDGFNYDLVIKEIKEGDTTLKYAVGDGGDTPESRFDSMIKAMERGFDKWITPHRCVRW